MHNLAVRHMWEALGRLGGVGWVGGGALVALCFPLLPCRSLFRVLIENRRRLALRADKPIRQPSVHLQGPGG